MQCHIDWKSINHKFNLDLRFLFNVANGRAPLEPYYGRFIGNFTEFAHKIKVHISLLHCLVRFYQQIQYKTSGNYVSVCIVCDFFQNFSIFLSLSGWCVCCRRIDTIYQGFRLRWHRTWCILLGWKNAKTQSRGIHHTISRGVHGEVVILILLRSFFFVLPFFLPFSLTLFIRNYHFLIPKCNDSNLHSEYNKVE